jgi:hypothetical protein
MYRIHKHSDHLLVKFDEDFDLNTIEAIIRDATRLPEYAYTNDIWLIGNHRSLLSLEELESMAANFKCMCPEGASRNKTAIVVEEGLTEAIVRLWIRELTAKVPFEMDIFHTLAEARNWIGVAEEKMA